MNAILLAMTLLGAAAQAEVHAASFDVSGLRCVIGDNSAAPPHHEGYNGVFAAVPAGEEESVFVPAYAGLNLEHYFDTRPRPDGDVFFEPRRAPMTFTRLGDVAVELHQPPTPVYGVESWTRFELRAPGYIDMDFRCIPRKDALESGLLGVFWASYINAPTDKSIYFLGKAKPDEPATWRQHCTPLHDHDSTVRQVDDTYEAPFREAGATLYSNFSPLRYDRPFFYGLVRGNVLIYIFDTKVDPRALIRFAHSPSGGGSTPDETDTNPAWDFQMLVPNAEVGAEYRLRMRFVIKPWVSREDVLAEVDRYLDGSETH